MGFTLEGEGAMEGRHDSMLRTAVACQGEKIWTFITSHSGRSH